jgi:hypothetical protein
MTAVTQERRDAIRNEHSRDVDDMCYQCEVGWPCDRIALLDALEAAEQQRDRSQEIAERLEDRWEAVLANAERYEAERDALQAKVDAALALIDSPHRVLLAQVRAALTDPPKAEPETIPQGARRDSRRDEG